MENVTNISETYNQLNNSFVNLINELEDLDDRVLYLENENMAFIEEMENLTSEIENLTSEIEDFDYRSIQLESENEALKIEIGNLKISEKEQDNFLVYLGIILGLLAIVIVIIGVTYILKKLRLQMASTSEEESPESITPEQ